MANRNRIAMTIAGDKAQHPERYCPARRCLWKTSTIGPDGDYILNAEPCAKHQAEERRALEMRRLRPDRDDWSPAQTKEEEMKRVLRTNA